MAIRYSSKVPPSTGSETELNFNSDVALSAIFRGSSSSGVSVTLNQTSLPTAYYVNVNNVKTTVCVYVPTTLEAPANLSRPGGSAGYHTEGLYLTNNNNIDVTAVFQFYVSSSGDGANPQPYGNPVSYTVTANNSPTLYLTYPVTGYYATWVVHFEASGYTNSPERSYSWMRY